MNRQVLPTESEAQRIGRMACKCFAAKQPDSWASKELAGTDDFGYDYQVQVISDGQVHDIFRAQLKGTESPSTSADGSFLSVQLKASTVRYYARATEPIMLVVCDLSASEFPIQCPLYFCWIEEELRRINQQGIPEDQDFVTLRVPTSSVLNSETDVSAYLAKARSIAQVGKALDTRMEHLRPDLLPTARVEFVERVPTGFQSRGFALVEAMTEQPATAWPEAPRGSYPWHLKEAASHLAVGDAELAIGELTAASALEQSAQPLELAEASALKAKAFALQGENEKARNALADAVRLSNGVSRYVASLVDAEIRLRFEAGGGSDLSDLLRKV